MTTGGAYPLLLMTQFRVTGVNMIIPLFCLTVMSFILIITILNVMRHNYHNLPFLTISLIGSILAVVLSFNY